MTWMDHSQKGSRLISETWEYLITFHVATISGNNKDSIGENNWATNTQLFPL